MTAKAEAVEVLNAINLLLADLPHAFGVDIYLEKDRIDVLVAASDGQDYVVGNKDVPFAKRLNAAYHKAKEEYFKLQMEEADDASVTLRELAKSVSSQVVLDRVRPLLDDGEDLVIGCTAEGQTVTLYSNGAQYAFTDAAKTLNECICDVFDFLTARKEELCPDV